VEWNFTKFVADRSGRIVARFPSRVAPDSPEFRAAVAKALAG
jgi:glutathione peroxidase